MKRKYDCHKENNNLTRKKSLNIKGLEDKKREEVNEKTEIKLKIFLDNIMLKLGVNKAEDIVGCLRGKLNEIKNNNIQRYTEIMRMGKERSKDYWMIWSIYSNLYSLYKKSILISNRHPHESFRPQRNEPSRFHDQQPPRLNSQIRIFFYLLRVVKGNNNLTENHQPCFLPWKKPKTKKRIKASKRRPIWLLLLHWPADPQKKKIENM